MSEIEKEIEVPKEATKKPVIWFCTIFNKKNNRAIVTFNTIWEFTENHGRAYGIVNWILWEIDEKDKAESNKDLLDFINDKITDTDKLAAFQAMFKEFDSKYRILIGK